MLAEERVTKKTALTVPDGAKVGVGDLIFIGTEAMLVTGRDLLLNASDLTGVLTAKNDDTLVHVDAGTDFHVGEVITGGAEQMLITGIATNDLIVKRAYGGSVLASHAIGDDCYVERTLTVVRGAVGTTKAAHIGTDPITRNVPPQMVADLTMAEAITRLYDEESGYARNITSAGGGVVELSGKALADLRQQTLAAYGKSRGPVAI